VAPSADRRDWSRREFLKASGTLVVTFGAAAVGGDGLSAQGQFETRASRVDPAQLDSWIAVNADGSVRAFTGKCELGQGMLTAQTQLVAEELGVPVERVRLTMCDTDVCPDQGTTSGSQSTPTNFNERNLALAAATAREALVRLGSARLGVAATDLVAENGFVASRVDRTKRVAFGDLVAGRKFSLPLDGGAKRRTPDTWTVLGQPVRRIDMPDLVTGRAEYVQNVRVAGMLHGVVVRPPTVGATLTQVDERSVSGLPGVVKVVRRNNFVGVVAGKPFEAMQAARALKLTWTPGPALPAQASFYDHLRKQPSRDALVVDSGDVDAALGGASNVLRATYLHPYQMHGSVGSSCAVADAQPDKVTVWSSTQSAYPTRSGVAMLLGVPVDRVRVIFVRGSGCYGINGADTVAYDAALLSHAVGKPVRVQLSRRDEMAWENYGFPYVIDQRVGLNTDGSIAVWDCESWFASLGGRPGYQAPGNVVTGMLAGFTPASVTPQRAAAPSAFNNGSNAAPSYVTGRVGGRASGTGRVTSERVLTHTIQSPFFTGPLRSPSRLQNTFAHECFLDEVAAHQKADPIEYRLRHIRDPRLQAVVSAAGRAAGWQPRPSPQAGTARTGVARGRGFACVLYEGDNGYVSLVAEVEVDQSSGAVTARRLVVAQDCGPVSNPDGMRNQLEGGALQGLSRALGEEVTWDDQKVTSVDWRTYHSLPLGFAVPQIESVLIDPHEGEAMGAGETAITVVAAAVGNAIFDATGVRIRQVPFTPERVKAALTGRGTQG
jgi:CO/xanthine dehydrogenase Mo-binding subunit